MEYDISLKSHIWSTFQYDGNGGMSDVEVFERFLKFYRKWLRLDPATYAYFPIVIHQLVSFVITWIKEISNLLTFW